MTKDQFSADEQQRMLSVIARIRASPLEKSQEEVETELREIRERRHAFFGDLNGKGTDFAEIPGLKLV